MILLFTDFGFSGPYVGQMTAVLRHLAPPGTPVIDLMHDAPALDPMAAGYLLAAVTRDLRADSVVLAVVDPGVGTERAAAVARIGGRWFVGPDNGLFEPTLRQAGGGRWWRLNPEKVAPGRPVSASFHGRDLFAPAAARLARGETPEGRRQSAIARVLPGRFGPAAEPWGAARPITELARPDWPDDLARIVHVDGYGNAVTGLRAAAVDKAATVGVGDHALRHARVFGAVPAGTAFWYGNSSGLVEIAVSGGSAADVLGLSRDLPVAVSPVGTEAA